MQMLLAGPSASDYSEMRFEKARQYFTSIQHRIFKMKKIVVFNDYSDAEKGNTA